VAKSMTMNSSALFILADKTHKYPHVKILQHSTPISDAECDCLAEENETKRDTTSNQLRTRVFWNRAEANQYKAGDEAAYKTE